MAKKTDSKVGEKVQASQSESRPKDVPGGPLMPLIRNKFNQIQTIYETKKDPDACSTGFSDLDELIQGFRPGELVVLGGYTSSGKSSLAMNFCANISIEGNKQKTLYFQKNFNANSMMQRLLASQARVDSGRLGSGYIADTDWPRIQRAAHAILSAGIHLHGPHMKVFPQSIDEVVDEISDYMQVADQAPGLIVVDSLQDFCSSESYSNETRHPAYTHAAHRLKKIAVEYDTPVLVTSWINSTTDKRYNKRPGLADLVGVAGNAADIADKVIFIHRESQFCEHCQQKDGSCVAFHERDAEVIVAKNNNGPIGMVLLNFFGELFRFEGKRRE